jgi:hypothetical protein
LGIRKEGNSCFEGDTDIPPVCGKTMPTMGFKSPTSRPF